MGILIIMTKTRVVNPFFENVFVFLRFFSKMYEKNEHFSKKDAPVLEIFCSACASRKGNGSFS